MNKLCARIFFCLVPAMVVLGLTLLAVVWPVAGMFGVFTFLWGWDITSEPEGD